MENRSELLSIFCEARERVTPEERAAYLDEACRNNPDLRARVEALLHAEPEVGNFLGGDASRPNLAATVQASVTETAGIAIGPYKLLQMIGEGGMGAVWMAEQTQPVQRKVALKIIKAGLDSRHVLARFEAERQALALMDHPNIAKVLDGGATAAGRPFFVMELVKGQPITKYCDEHRLTPRQRLELFVPVCQAIQHAHQKGIIHRDVKPSNVLVAPYDGKPVVKVIDFGVAKATGQRLTEKTLFTELGAVVGTVEYMSPEQAELNNQDIDTRSDIYSLGVLLYELLTGSTPLTRQRLKQAAFDEMLRLIREEEPPRPSTRLSTTEELPSVAANRGLEPKRLSGLVRGDLDWIVMKALEKDRSRRYETANSFAQDIERYLADEPVLACPPSAGYRLRKFVRRNRRNLVTGALVGVLLLVALASVAGNLVWRAQERAARQHEIERGVSEALAQAQAYLGEGDKQMDNPVRWQMTVALAEGAVRRAEELLAAGEATAELVERLGQVQDAVAAAQRDSALMIALDEAALAQAETLSSENRFATARAVPKFREAFRAYGLAAGQGDAKAAFARIRQRPAAVEDAILAALDEWDDLASRPKLGIAEPHREWLRTVLEAAEPEDAWGRKMRAARRETDSAKRQTALEALAASADVEKVPVRALTRLASPGRYADRNAIRPPEAVKLLRRARRHYPADFWVNEHLGTLVQNLTPPERDEAVRFLTVAVALRPGSPGAHYNLGLALKAKGEIDEAIACYQKASALDPTYAAPHDGWGNALHAKGRVDEAITHWRKAVALDPKDARFHNNLAIGMWAKGEVDEAIACCRKALDIDPKRAQAYAVLGSALARKGQADDAIASYRTAIDIDPMLASAYHNLGLALKAKGRLDDAIACFRTAIELDQKAIEHNPEMARVHHALGTAFLEKGQADEAITSHRRAIALDPNSAAGHNDLGGALYRKGQVEEAIASYQKAIALDPKHAMAHYNLSVAFLDKGQMDEAMACCRKAIDLNPKHAAAHGNLGAALYEKGQVDEAMACDQKAIALDPKYAPAHNNLGLGLARKGQLERAIASYRTAIDIDPKLAAAHNNLGDALKAQRRFDEAIASYREAIKLRPDKASTHISLGSILCEQKRDYEGAIACFQKAIKLEPNNPWAHYNLGNVLLDKGQVDEAGDCFRKAIELDPKHAEAHCNLGHLLSDQGRFGEALASFQRGHELGTKRKSWRYPSAEWLRRAERLAALESKLPAVLKGELKPKDTTERLGFAGVCQAKQLHHAATRIYADTFAADPKPAEDLRAGHRYNAACSAALAAAGQGKDAAKPDDRERTRLRRQALDWLRAHLSSYEKLYESGPPAARMFVERQMKHWQKDSDLASIRGEEALSKLPADERVAFARLWADVTALAKRLEK
jgi:tetratricopeptide (TPR) repeat protein/serine/threonine protein kinase